MRRVLLLLFLALLALSLSVEAQETYFGKNKVRYKDFDWKYIQTRHFDIYFYENAYPTAKFAAEVMESSYVEIADELNYRLQRRVPLFIYNAHNDFQQTNIVSGLLPEGVAGFTEAFKSRIVMPFNGSYEDFRHTLHHELVHAFQYDMLYGNAFTSLLSQRRLFSMPLWFSEGMAEYSARHGWDYWSDMFLRDATINDYLIPPLYVGGYLAYRQGQAMVKYIADKYGDDKIGEILQKGKIYLTMDRAMKASINEDQEEFWKEFQKEMKRRYWPQITKREEPDEFAKQLTHSGKDGSYFNEKPAFSPDGDKIAIFTDRSDYTEIVLISAINGKHLKTLVKAERSGDLESLHSYVSGMSFSPDGQSLAFVAKSDGKEAIFLYSLKDDKIYIKQKFDYYNIIGPSWSPDGKKIAFAALDGHKRDLYVWHIESGQIEQVTDDRFDDVDPTWLANSSELIFSSDRPHPVGSALSGRGQPYGRPGTEKPGEFDYGNYNLFRVELGSYRVSPLDVGIGPNKMPQVSPDGEKVAFVSNRNGIDNLYIGYLDSSKVYAVTNILGGVVYHSWGPDGEKIAMSAFHKGRFDIFMLNDLKPVGDNGVLEPTDFVLGKYNATPQPVTDVPDTTLVAAQDVKLVTATGDTVGIAPENVQPVDTLLAVDTSAVSDTLAEVSDTTPVVDTLPVLAVDSSGLIDTLVVAAVDSAESDSTTNTGEEKASEPITETGTYGDEYVFVADSTEDKPLDSLMEDMGGITGEQRYVEVQEPAAFDSIPPKLPSGEYEIHDYEVKFTPDFVGGGLSYDTFFGLRGQSYLVFSDYLGNHQIYIATDLVNTIDQSNLQVAYFNYKHRINYGVGAFHTKNFYLDSRDYLFSDRFYGFQAYFARPFSIFSRLDLNLSQFFIDRQHYDEGDPNFGDDRSSKVTTGELSYVSDNILWGNTGPVNGRRAKISFETGVNLFDASDVEFYAIELDYRKYWHFKKTFSMALRFAGGASEGSTPKLYFLGGTTNWIGTRTLDAKVYDVENLYFSDVVTPLRGQEYYELSGNRYALINWEFRFPVIYRLITRFPLALQLANVNGAIFTDVGAAWNNNDFKGATSAGGSLELQDIKAGFGFGLRANLFGWILLRYDLAWATNLARVSDHPRHYFSFGAEF